MKIWDKFLLWSYLRVFLFTSLCLIVIIVVIDFTEKNYRLSEKNVPSRLVILYYLNFIPYLFGLLTPINVFISTIYLNSSLAYHSEIIAIKVAGVRFWRWAFPYILGATLIGGFSFFLNNMVIPSANVFRMDFERTYLNRIKNYSENNIHMKIDHDTFLLIRSYSNETSTAYGVTIEKMSNGELVEKLTSRRMVWDTLNNRWSLESWRKIGFRHRRNLLSQGARMDTTILLHPSDFEEYTRQWESLTLKELNAKIDLLRLRGSVDVQQYLIERYIRIMRPAVLFILMFIGIVVSSTKSRDGVGYKVALGFLIAFSYIILFVLSRAIAEASSVDPLITIWFPSILFAILAVVLGKTMMR